MFLIGIVAVSVPSKHRSKSKHFKTSRPPNRIVSLLTNAYKTVLAPIFRKKVTATIQQNAIQKAIKPAATAGVEEISTQRTASTPSSTNQAIPPIQPIPSIESGQLIDMSFKPRTWRDEYGDWNGQNDEEYEATKDTEVHQFRRL